MATTKLIVSVAILVLGTASLGSAQWRHQGGYTYQPYYPQQQQRYYQNRYHNKAQTGVAVTEAEWVCKNPKTGDMMIIIPEEVPVANGQVQWQHQSTGRPVQPGYPGYPQQPTYPQTQPTFPQTPVYPTVPSYPPTQPPNQGTTPNTGGEGVIDIRFGEKK